MHDLGNLGDLGGLGSLCGLDYQGGSGLVLASGLDGLGGCNISVSKIVLISGTKDESAFKKKSFFVCVWFSSSFLLKNISEVHGQY